MRNFSAGLGVIQVISTFAVSNALTISKRAPVTSVINGGVVWNLQGCYTDVGRTLTGGGYTAAAMTVELCVAYCSNAKFIYAGLEYSSECYCGNTIAAAVTKVALVNCAMPCSGNATQDCGGGSTLSLYWNGKQGPETNLGPTDWPFAGCYTEGVGGRALLTAATTLGGPNMMTIKACAFACQMLGLPLAGVEYASQCFCGEVISNGAKLAPEGLAGCNMLCSGNSSEYCGGPDRLNVYNYKNGIALPPYNNAIASSTSLLGTSTTSSKSSSASSKSSSSSKASPAASSVRSSSSFKTPSSSTKPSSTPLNSASSSKVSSSTKLSSSTKSSSLVSQSTISSSSKRTTSTSSIRTSSTPSIKFSFSFPIFMPSSTSSSKKSSTISTSTISSSKQTSSSKLSSVTTIKTSSISSLRSSSSSLSIKSSTFNSVKSSAISSSTNLSSSPAKTSASTSSRAAASSTSSKSLLSLTSSLRLSSSTASSSKPLASSSFLRSLLTLASSLSSSKAASSSSSSKVLLSLTSSSLKTSSISSTRGAASSSSSKAWVSLTSTLGSKTSSASSFKAVSSSSSPVTIKLTSSLTTSSSPSASPTLGHKRVVDGLGSASYLFQGCYTESTGQRALALKAYYDYPTMTLEKCAVSCDGYNYFGIEFGGECFCDNIINGNAALAPIADCNMVCPGSPYEYCGSGNRLELYLLSSVALSSSSSPSSSRLSTVVASSMLSSFRLSTVAASSTRSSSRISLTASAVSSSSATASATGFTYVGCFLDGLPGRILRYGQPDDPRMTQDTCEAKCSALGYKIAGMEWSVQCYCDNEIFGGELAPSEADCNLPCGGNAAQKCGAGNRISVYSVGLPKIHVAPSIQKTGLPANWAYQGCLQDNIPSMHDVNQIISTFPYMVWNNASNTPSACIAQCEAFGYNAAGVEYGSQCFCGDTQNIQVASSPGISTNPQDVQNYYRSRVPQIVPDAQCDAICAGDGQWLCGSGNLMAYYAWVGTKPLYEWGFPQGAAAAGEYSMLLPGVIVPLIVSQTVNGKVQFVEKYGSGIPNATGVFELDLSVVPAMRAWRPMKGFQTDVFCAAGLTLPDKAGRQITVGGWAGASNFGVRLYTPDGAEGVAGTNDWVEAPGTLSLQVPRWYASALIMANGSMLIVGGEIGSNAAQQPNLEILPATGVPDPTTISGYSNTTVYLNFLERTAPFNLYPFICVVPSGIFIAYYNEARILDEKTFQTIKTLPNMPAAVNDPTGGRTYQLEGTMVLLPQYAPYNKNLEVLICGGSTAGGGYALDNCITTAPEDPNPVWTIERMPSRRVMPCIAGLPDGTYLILNGGQHGVAGFGLGGDPNLNAVLYDPRKPYNTRMSVMGNTTIARLYHSEATVLLDGRVLVSGSDPTGMFIPDPANWPEEYRVEVFTPPYLLSGKARPTFSIVNTDWDYGQAVTFTLTSGSTANLKVSMLGSVVSTHGNSMGQRTIFPEVTCAGVACTIVAPGTAHIAPPGWFMLFVLDGAVPSVGKFVRIGKDPANLGNWPNLPGFVTPGV